MGDNIENRVSALSIGTKIGFLDLSANTRNQIYDLLLLNRSPEGDLHVINVVDSPSRRQSGYGPYRRYLDGRALKPNYHWRAPVAEPNNSCNFMYPAILRTCKQIGSEGAYVLYSKNVFGINLTRERNAPSRLFEIEEQQSLATSTFDSLLSEPVSINDNQLAELSSVAFIRQIGPSSTATIQHLELYGNFATDYRVVRLLTQIFKQHFTSLKTASFYLICKNQDARSYNPQEYEAAPTIQGPLHRTLTSNGFAADDTAIGHSPFSIIIDALKCVFDQLEDLEVIKYRGNWHFHHAQTIQEMGDYHAHYGVPAGKRPPPYSPIASQGLRPWRQSMAETDKIEELSYERSRLKKLERGLNAKPLLLPLAINNRLLQWRVPVDRGGTGEWHSGSHRVGDYDGQERKPPDISPPCFLESYRRNT